MPLDTTGPVELIRVCSKCGQTKPIDCFHRSRKEKNGRKARCADCENAKTRAWHANRPRRKHSQEDLRAIAEATAAAEPFRVCCTCRITKPIVEFALSSHVPSGINGRCKACCGIAQKTWIANNKERYLARARERSIERRYGLTKDEISSLIDEQGGCAICRAPLVAGTRECNVDHNHKTGKVRGILCGGCNTGIGLLQENVDVLLSAVVYLRAHSDDDSH